MTDLTASFDGDNAIPNENNASELRMADPTAFFDGENGIPNVNNVSELSRFYVLKVLSIVGIMSAIVAALCAIRMAEPKFGEWINSYDCGIVLIKIALSLISQLLKKIIQCLGNVLPGNCLPILKVSRGLISLLIALFHQPRKLVVPLCTIAICNGIVVIYLLKIRKDLSSKLIKEFITVSFVSVIIVLLFSQFLKWPILHWILIGVATLSITFYEFKFMMNYANEPEVNILAAMKLFNSISNVFSMWDLLDIFIEANKTQTSFFHSCIDFIISCHGKKESILFEITIS